jgi:adenosylcobinamide kinase/adenosylcobinamide-phosphate guanylyltransferase
MNVHLVTGGARSGKSRHAERLAAQLGGTDVLYIATAEGLDDEMQQRIALHRQRRPSGWRTVESYRNPGAVLRESTSSVVLLDCLTLLASNVYLSTADPAEAALAVQDEVSALLNAAAQASGELIVVTNEVGMGIVPETALGRGFRDALGCANQQVALAATTVTLLISGIPLTIKTA